MEGESALERLSRVLQLLRRTMYSTQIEFAAALGVSVSIVDRWESGLQAPTRVQTHRLRAWCNRYDCFTASSIVVDGHLISPDELDGLVIAARQGA
jgi:transcriptional regulator with XRE-family HTH domain